MNFRFNDEKFVYLKKEGKFSFFAINKGIDNSMEVASTVFFEIKGIASEFFDLILQGKTEFSTHIRTVAQTYGVEEVDVFIDLKNLLTEMLENQLITAGPRTIS